MSSGKVYFVGAGPGDPGLLTLEGKQILARADCIVYDSVVNRDLLRLARTEAEKVLVGRRGDSDRADPGSIDELLVARAREGKLVCRLICGDPLAFGNGATEAQAIAKSGLEFEVVPGISADQLNRFERLPLFGKRIAITRAREQAGGLREQLASLGAEVIEIPTIEIRPPDSWERLDGAIGRLGEFQYLLLTSVNGVRYFLERLAVSGRDVRALSGLTIGAIGPATAAEFARNGVKVDLIPSEYVAEGLLAALAGRDLNGKAFLIPRAKVARDLVPRVLEQRGARVEVLDAYQTVLPDVSPDELMRLLTPPPDAITFTSSSTATNFAKLVGEDRLAAVLRNAVIASVGPITSSTLRKMGVEVTLEARESTMAGLVASLSNHFGRVPRKD